MEESAEKFKLYGNQAGTYAQFSGTMTAVVLFFTGLIITNLDNYDPSVKVPVALLIVSIFGFLYGTLLYSNASEEVSKYNENGFLRAMYLGDTISEYLGLYFLVISIPLVINVVTEDMFLRIVSVIAALSGLYVYEFSGYSIVERHFSARHHIISIISLWFGAILFYTQLYGPNFVALATLFGLFIVGVAYVDSRHIPKA